MKLLQACVQHGATETIKLFYLFLSAQEQKEKFSQSLKFSSVINDHKRSSSDAGVSYTTRPNRERRVARRREIGHQRIDLQEIGDVRENGIQRALVRKPYLVNDIEL